jgi:hypothetical protein
MKKSKKTKKIITDEMEKNLTVQQLYDLRMQGWEHEKPVKDWRELMPKMETADDKNVSYYGRIGGTPKLADSKPVDPVENDPEFKELANRLGVTPKDLIIFRELMLERYVARYSGENYATPECNEDTEG